MSMERFVPFQGVCLEHLPGAVEEILKAEPGKKPCAIGFITTDDFYGFYLTWKHTNDISGYYGWEQAGYPEFLYQPLVDIVDACQDVDLCNPSEEKWAFAEGLLAVLAECIAQIPEEIFQRNGYQREDILFFSTMSDGDYIQELLNASVKLFNTPGTIDAYGLIGV